MTVTIAELAGDFNRKRTTKDQQDSEKPEGKQNREPEQRSLDHEGKVTLGKRNLVDVMLVNDLRW
jgi:hypothetical protein